MVLVGATYESFGPFKSRRNGSEATVVLLDTSSLETAEPTSSPFFEPSPSYSHNGSTDDSSSTSVIASVVSVLALLVMAALFCFLYKRGRIAAGPRWVGGFPSYVKHVIKFPMTLSTQSSNDPGGSAANANSVQSGTTLTPHAQRTMRIRQWFLPRVKIATANYVQSGTTPASSAQRPTRIWQWFLPRANIATANNVQSGTTPIPSAQRPTRIRQWFFPRAKIATANNVQSGSSTSLLSQLTTWARQWFLPKAKTAGVAAETPSEIIPQPPSYDSVTRHEKRAKGSNAGVVIEVDPDDDRDHRKRMFEGSAELSPSESKSPLGETRTIDNGCPGEPPHDTFCKRGPSSPACMLKTGVVEAMLRVAQEVSQTSKVPGLSDAAAIVSVLVNLVVDTRENSHRGEKRLRWCCSLITLLRRADDFLDKVCVNVCLQR